MTDALQRHFIPQFDGESRKRLWPPGGGPETKPIGIGAESPESRAADFRAPARNSSRTQGNPVQDGAGEATGYVGLLDAVVRDSRTAREASDLPGVSLAGHSLGDADGSRVLRSPVTGDNQGIVGQMTVRELLKIGAWAVPAFLIFLAIFSA